MPSKSATATATATATETRKSKRTLAARNQSVPPPTTAGKKRKAADVSDTEHDKPAPKRGKRAQSAVPAPPKGRGAATSAAAAALSLRGTLNTTPVHASHPRPSRRLLIFGSGDMGQLGLGTEKLDEITYPRLHAWFEENAEKGTLGGPGAGIETAWAGGMHTLVVDEEGKVWSWGVNDNAALGRPTVDVPDPENPGAKIEQEILETQPMLVQSLKDSGFRTIKVAAGDSISVALGDNGDLRAWGSFRSSEGLLGFSGSENASKTQFEPMPIQGLSKYRFVAVACGGDHAMALTTAGHLWVWGNGQQAQLGHRIIERRKLNALVPERLGLRKIVRIGTGTYHSFAQNEAGDVFAWGLNTFHQTGVSAQHGGNESIIWVPTLVEALQPSVLGNGRRVVEISGGEHHTLFLLSDGSVLACGRADDGQIGLPSEHPIVQAITEQKSERARKLAENPELELDPVDDVVAELVTVEFPPGLDGAKTEIVQISAGPRHNLAVSRAGNAYSWGTSENGQLGLGPDVTTQRTPIRISNKVLNSGYKVEFASSGGQHCILLASKPAETS